MSLPEQTVAIHRMTAADVERVMELAAHLETAPNWARTAYLAALDPQAMPPRIALVARDAATGALAGFAVASVLPPQAELETIAVAPGLQRRGVGRQLFAVLRAELRGRQVTEVMLEVRASNQAAVGLYRALGFAEAGRRVRYYIDPVEDAVLLRCELA